MKRYFNSLFLVVFSLMLVTLKLEAQTGVFQPGDYRDGIYDKENAVNRRFIPYTHLREADVTWERRVWRKIDLREKINQTLYYPIGDPIVNRMSLMQMMVKYVLNGQIVAFKDEEFTTPIERSEIRAKLVTVGDSIEQETFLPDGSQAFAKVAGPVDSTWIFENLREIEVKEDWFFDRQKSVLEVRIIGLGFNALLKGKDELGAVNQFYVYFPACRPYFAKHEVFNVRNDSERRTFEDIFWKRQFASTVYKESNVFDREVDRYAKGIDALLESDRIKGDIFRMEHDLWQF